VLGKAGAYFVLYLVNIIITQVWVYHWFNLPDKASLLPALALMVPFLLAVIFLGMALSTFFSRREHSILFVVFLSPIVLFLSGLSWPASAIPQWLHGVAHLFPSTIMVPAWLRVRTMGAELHHVGEAFLFLTLQAVVYFGLAVGLFYRAGKGEKGRLGGKGRKG
jgi:ABC-2 type transport system permease protein